MTGCEDDNHVWKNDPMFEDETIQMISSESPTGKEMRQVCELCDYVRYMPK